MGVSWESNAEHVLELHEPDALEFYWSHTVKVLNSGTSPLSHASIWLLHSVRGYWNYKGRNSIQGLDTLLPGAEKTVSFSIDWGRNDIDPPSIALGEMTGFGFRDVHGQCWMNEQGKLIRVRSEEAYE